MLQNPVYVGKLRWREAVYEGHHPALVSEVLFENAREIVKQRAADANSRPLHNGGERLLAGVIKCARDNRPLL